MAEHLSPIEKIKEESKGLRGTIKESLKDELTGSLREDDQSLLKFHGMYQQDDRDRRETRAEKKLERLFSFMIRLRLPGGSISSKQWLTANEVADQYSTGVIKITSRQTIQLHGIFKSQIKPTIKAFNTASLDSIATCGDINRNVLCSVHPAQSAVQKEVFAYADKISSLLMPKTRAYYEIWLDEEKFYEKKDEEDPLYQDRYLPRKFKIGIAIPPNNDTDVLTNDIGLIAIIENEELKGFNIAVGGGLSTTHGSEQTYARLGTVIGFTDTEEKTLKTVYEILTVQRDFGNRSDRKLARLKYTVDRLGVENFRSEVQKRIGFKLLPAKDFRFEDRTDYFGWIQSSDGNWHYTAFVENGRITDSEETAIKSGLLEIARQDLAHFYFTASQNIIIGNVSPQHKQRVEDIIAKHKISNYTENTSTARKNSMACVALPTCPLALAEGQRYMPSLMTKIENLLREHDLAEADIIIRLTGCPNGCARSHNSEIGFVGIGPGRYNFHLGGDHEGMRLNKIFRENLDENEILEELNQWLAKFNNEKLEGERFGDFTFRITSN